MDDKKTLIAQLWAKIRELQAQLLAMQPSGLQPLVKRKAELLVAEMNALGYQVTVYQGFRSIAEQDYLYAQGRTRPGPIVTNAKGGDSLHNYGVAIDVVFVKNGKPSWDNNHPWDKLGFHGKRHGFEWGGDWTTFVDRPHLQMTLGHTLQDFKNKKVDYKRYA